MAKWTCTQGCISNVCEVRPCFSARPRTGVACRRIAHRNFCNSALERALFSMRNERELSRNAGSAPCTQCGAVGPSTEYIAHEASCSERPADPPGINVHPSHMPNVVDLLEDERDEWKAKAERLERELDDARDELNCLRFELNFLKANT